MLTADKLRAIVERDRRTRAHPNGGGEMPITAQADRADLLDLLRAVAGELPRLNDGAWCIYCGSTPFHGEPHEPDCPEPVLDALREERPATGGVMLAQDVADGVPLGGPQEIRFTITGGAPGPSGVFGRLTIMASREGIPPRAAALFADKPKEEP